MNTNLYQIIEINPFNNSIQFLVDIQTLRVGELNLPFLIKSENSVMENWQVGQISGGN